MADETNLYYNITPWDDDLYHAAKISITHVADVFIGKEKCGTCTYEYAYYFVNNTGMPHYLRKGKFIKCEELYDSYLIDDSGRIKLSREFVDKTFRECGDMLNKYSDSEEQEDGDYVEFCGKDDLRKIAGGCGCVISFDFRFDEADSYSICKLTVIDKYITLTLFSDSEFESILGSSFGLYSATLNHEIEGWHIRGEPGDFVLTNNQMRFLCKEIQKHVDEILRLAGIDQKNKRKIYRYYKKISNDLFQNSTLIEDDPEFISLFD